MAAPMLLLLLPMAASLAFADDDDVRARAEASVRHEDAQTKLEFGTMPSETEGWLEWLPNWKGKSFSIPAPTGIVGLSYPIVMALIVVAVVLVGLAIARSIQVQRTMQARALEGAIHAATAARDRTAEEWFAEADRLAAVGHWAEAIHALLLCAIRKLSDEFGAPKKSRTSRELASYFRLEGERKSAFWTLVQNVERAVFGGVEPDRATFEACKLQLARLQSVAA